jgi:signal transduction histidine kinase
MKAAVRARCMKVKFASRINTVLFVFPALLILIIYFGIGVWLYFSGASDLLNDFHAAQLVTMLSDKKNGIEMWFDVRKKSVEEIGKNPVVSAGLSGLREKKGLRKVEDSEETAAKKIPGKSGSSQSQKLAKYISDFSQFKAISFISGEGGIIWSTNAETIGKEWPDKAIKQKFYAGNAAVTTGRTNEANSIQDLIFIAPVAGKGKNADVILIAQPNAADLAAAMKAEKGFYETGKVAIIADDGMVVAARDMTDVGRVKYNVPAGDLSNVDYRDGLFFITSQLKFEGLRLIATLDAIEAAKPLKPLLDVYLAFAGVVFLIVLLQSLVLAPLIINKPFDKIMKAMQAVGEGDLKAINLRHGFIGETRLMAASFSKMLIGLSRKKSAHERVASPDTADRSKILLAEVLIVEAKVRLEGIRKRLAAIMAGHMHPGGDIPDVAGEAKALIETLDSLSLLIRIKDGSVKISMKKCDLREMLKEAENESRMLLGGKEIELIIDCHANLDDKVINSDPKALKKMITALLRHAVRVTDVGTITLLASHEAKGGVKYLEIALSDTGRGVDRQAIEWVLKEGTFPSQNLDLGIAREFAEALGGRTAMESLQGRGSVVTILIPLKGGVPKTEGKKK